MIDGNIDILSLQGDIVDSISLEGNLLPVGPKGDKGDPGFSPVVTTSKSGKTTTIKFETATGNVFAYIQDGEDGQGSGDMLTDVYDQNKNGIVDNAEKVNNHTVLTDVPSNAIFTDTTYTAGTNVSINNNVISATDTTYENKNAVSGGIDVSLCTTGEKYNWNNKVDSNGNATTTSENTSFNLTNTLEAPLEIDLKGNTSQTGTPTPSSPIPVNVVSGDNTITISDDDSDTSTYSINLPVENKWNYSNISSINGGSISNEIITSNAISSGYGGVSATISGITLQAGTYYIALKLKLNSGSASGFNAITRVATPNTSTITTLTFQTPTSEYQIYKATLTCVEETTLTNIGVQLGGNNTNAVLSIKEIMVSKIDASYTPYGTTPIELNKIGTYQDYIYKENDKWYLHKEIGKVVLNGSESWTANGQTEVLYEFYTTSVNKAYGFANFYTNKFEVINGQLTSYYQSNGRDNNNRINIRVKTSDLTSYSASALQTWLSNNNVEVVYQLNTPINTEITYTPLIEQLNTLEEAQSYEGTTNINQVNNDLPFILDITAFLDTYDGRYESLDSQIQNNKNDIQDKLVNVGTSVDSNYRTNILNSKNLFDKSTMVLKAFINATSGELANSDDFRTIYFMCQPNTTYTFSKSVSSNRYIVAYSSNANVITPQTLTNISYDNTFTTTSNTKIVYIMISRITDDTTPIQQILDSIMINEGSTPLQYEPYLTPSINVDGEEIYSKMKYLVDGDITYFKFDKMACCIINVGNITITDGKIATIPNEFTCSKDARNIVNYYNGSNYVNGILWVQQNGLYIRDNWGNVPSSASFIRGILIYTAK